MLIVGIVMVKRSPEPAGRFGGLISIVGLAVICTIGFVFSIFKTIDPGKVGVQVLFGKVQDHILESGLHVINPLVDVTTFDIQTQNYTMSGTTAKAICRAMMPSGCYHLTGWR
jgi:regulator of protease activity HflC (stomatin/prohibitin superfamily)